VSTLLTADRTAEEVSVVFSVAEFFDTAFDAHLTFQRDPEKQQRGKRVAGQILAFGAVVIGEPAEATLIVIFDQHDTAARFAFGADGGQGHGVDFRYTGSQCLIEPAGELGKRIGGNIGFRQLIALVIGADISYRHTFPLKTD
jgi:hypothetical protein